MPDILHCAEMPWGESLVAQRGATEGMAHKLLGPGRGTSRFEQAQRREGHLPDGWLRVRGNQLLFL